MIWVNSTVIISILSPAKPYPSNGKCYQEINRLDYSIVFYEILCLMEQGNRNKVLNGGGGFTS